MEKMNSTLLSYIFNPGTQERIWTNSMVYNHTRIALAETGMNQDYQWQGHKKRYDLKNLLIQRKNFSETIFFIFLWTFAKNHGAIYLLNRHTSAISIAETPRAQTSTWEMIWKFTKKLAWPMTYHSKISSIPQLPNSTGTKY